MYIARIALILVAAILTAPTATAAGWGKNKEVTCYHDDNGNAVVLTREVCQLHFDDKQTQRALEVYEQAVTDLKLKEPPDNCGNVDTEARGWCAFEQYVFNEQVAEIRALPSQGLQLQNNREERSHEKTMQTRRMILDWATFGVNTYVALQGSRDRGIGGGVSFRGDTISGKAGGGAGGGGDAGGPGGGSEVGKQGDTYQVYVERGANMQLGGGDSAVSGQENYEDTAQRNPVLSEGATFSPTNNEQRDSTRTIGLSGGVL